MAVGYDQFLDWLEADGYDPDLQEAPEAGLDWSIRTAVGDITVNVLAPSDSPYVVVQVAIQLAPEHQRQYNKLPGDAKEAFQNRIKSRLVVELPDYNMNPSEEEFRVILSRALYPEDLTRQMFMDAVRKVHHLGTAVTLIAQNFLQEREGAATW